MAGRPELVRGSILGWALSGAVLVEFLLLRTVTRALIHIPGLGRFESQVSALAELGRVAYYAAIVLLFAVLIGFSITRSRSGSGRDLAVAVAIVLFIVTVVAARAGVVSGSVVGWLSLAIVTAVVSLSWRGIRSLPIALFLGSSVAAGWSVLGQGQGGGLSGFAVDWLVMLAEVLLVLAAVTLPLTVGRRPTPASLMAGVVAAVAAAAALMTGGSTLSIIILWNIGLPGWLPWFAYALAIGALTTSLWLAVTSGQSTTVVGLVLLLAGGVGLISTYQTGLVLAATLFLSVPPHQLVGTESAVNNEQAFNRSVESAVVGG